MILTQTRTEHLIVPTEAKFMECYEVSIKGESSPVEYDKMIRHVTHEVSKDCVLLNFSMVKTVRPIKFSDKTYRYDFQQVKGWTQSAEIFMPDRSYKRSYCNADMITESNHFDGYQLVFIDGTTKQVVIR